MASRRITVAAAAATAVIAAASCGTGSPIQSAAEKASAAGPKTRPNIVFILTDDLHSNLLPYMPNVKRMQQRGTTFSNFFLTDSLCCPSRATMLTGRYPHNTGVFTNQGSDGGYATFNRKGNHKRTFATSLKAAGYNTALLGKYMNGYQPTMPVPPGWTEWYVAGNGYPNYNYKLNENGRLVSYGKKPSDYLTDVLSQKSIDFAKRSVAAKKPFMLELSVFTPHGPATPAPRDKGKFPKAKVPRTPAFNEADMSDKPAWIKGRPKLTKKQIKQLDTTFRKRARSVLAIDKAIGDMQAALRASGADRNTYFVFTSDNGFHMGEHRLMGGKQTAYDTDIKVPLIVTGPGVPAGRTVSALTQNTDLCPTFTELGRARPPAQVDGISLVPYLKGKRPRNERDGVLIEHHGPNNVASDPDFQAAPSGNPPTYNALRTSRELYVEYANGQREYYDIRRDPHQLDNTVQRLSPGQLRKLKSMLRELTTCKGRECQK
ncbi:sulfatase-like hydrolase/transferase [Actinomadura rudentiformis]|uniref:Sulfatase-like hydrolase/transferase n=1 Tax=Actinomadura rudentiformis TaxID=359158 RepID=A0A6H9YV39_9ACTN|nr:sulfatase-like hydrolase/transferase [Actinomadura rudentiformis]KAB2352421.1 sulfatase-like hydrolase/transferase [Actinomadura rudentiformis]